MKVEVPLDQFHVDKGFGVNENLEFGHENNEFERNQSDEGEEEGSKGYKVYDHDEDILKIYSSRSISE